MKVTKIDEAKIYDAPKHFAMAALKLHEKTNNSQSKFWAGLSHFLPGGGAEHSASATEKFYFVVEGEITIKTDNEEKFILKKFDSIYLGPNESREIINESNLPASMLVIVSYPG